MGSLQTNWRALVSRVSEKAHRWENGMAPDTYPEHILAEFRFDSLLLREGDAAQRNGIATQTNVVDRNQHVAVKDPVLHWVPLQARADVGSRVSVRGDADRRQRGGSRAGLSGRHRRQFLCEW